MRLRSRLRVASRRAPAPAPAPVRARRGFSLIESLVASVLVSVAAVGVAKGVNTIQNANERANDALERAHVARVLSDSFRAIPYASLAAGTYSYFVNAAGEQVRPYGAFYRAEVTVNEPPMTPSPGGIGGRSTLSRKLVSVVVVQNPLRRSYYQSQ